MDLPTQNVLASPDAFFWRGTLILVINACCILCGLNEQKCNLHTLKLHSLICKEGQCPLVDSCVLMSTHGVDSPPSALALHQGLNGNPYTTVSSKVTARNVVVVLQLLSHVRLFLTPWTAACQASLSFTISQSLLKLMSMESVLRSNHLVLCRPSNTEHVNRPPRASNIPIWRL